MITKLSEGWRMSKFAAGILERSGEQDSSSCPVRSRTLSASVKGVGGTGSNQGNH